MADSYRAVPNYPEFVERNGQRYSVSVDTDRDGMIEYFHLIDTLTYNIFFEADYQIDSLTESQIWEIVDEIDGVEGTVDVELNRKESQSYLNILLDELTDSFGDEQTLQDDSNPSKATMRSIAKKLAGRDRQRKMELIARRRNVGLAQSTIDEAFGFEPGTTREIEAYDSDPRLSELRRYEYFIMLTELQESASAH